MNAYLEVTFSVRPENRQAAAAVYVKNRKRFLEQVKGAVSAEWLVREEDIQILHRFLSQEQALSYLSSGLFDQDVMSELTPLLEGEADVRIYSAAG